MESNLHQVSHNLVYSKIIHQAQGILEARGINLVLS